MKKALCKLLFPPYGGLTKTLHAMKIAVILLTVFSSQVAASGNAQTVTLSEKEAPLATVLSKIKAQTGCDFLYNLKTLQLAGKISIQVKNVSLTEALDACFENTPLTYSSKGNIIIISERENKQIEAPKPSNDNLPPPPLGGRVVNDSGKPLEGATVLIKGSNVGTKTDADGNFYISAESNSILVISFVGFETTEVKVGNQTNILVQLKPVVASGEQVIVVGYGTQKKVNLTGSISTVSAQDFANRPVSSVSNALQGKMAGVTVTTTNGQPGKDFGTIYVRGIGTGLGGSPAISTPLVIVDGVVVSSIEEVNPGDIAGISVLKDAASAAIYGARASNGVILITTKNGQRGHLQIQYNGYVGLQSVIHTPDFLPSWQQAQLYNEALVNEGLSPRWTDTDIQLFKDGTDKTGAHPNTDWLKRFYSEPGYQQNHDLSLSGGDEKTQFRFSLGYLNQQGNVKKQDYKKYNVRFNINSRFNKNLAMNANLSYLYAPFTEPMSSRWGGFTDMLYVLNRISNTVPEKWANGAWGYITDGNPLAWLASPSVNQSQNYAVTGNVGLDWSPLQGLHLKPLFGYRSGMNQQQAFVAEQQFYTGGPVGAPLNPTLYEGPTNLTNASDKTTYTILQILIEYEKSIRDNHFKLLVGASQEKSNYSYFSAYRQGFLNTSITQLNAAPITGQNTSGTANAWALQSVFGRFNYNYAEKYLFEANLRYDGSSRFAKGERWGAFPSFSLGWVLSKEDFFEQMRNTVNSLKIRASWGRLGNQQISNYPTYSIVSPGQNYPFNQALSSGIAPTIGGNQDIQWETTEISGAGIDAAFLHNKLNVSIDYFSKKTNNILMVLPVASTYALSAPFQNAGAMTNNGIELSIGYKEKIGNVNIDVNGNMSYIKNKVTDLKGTGPIINGNTFYDVGYPFQSLYGYKAIGIYQTDDQAHGSAVLNSTVGAGDLIYEDVNHDGVIDAKDRMYLGSYFPKISYGFTANAYWKGFEFSLFLQGVAGVKANGGNLIGQVGPDVQKPTSAFLNAWTSTNHSATFPRLWYTYSQNDPNINPSSFWVKSASYLRLKNLTIAYNLPKSIIGKIHNIRIYYSGQNLLTFTKFYKWIDPEIGPSASFGAYPQVMVNSIGLNVTL